jgi:hypothetical protein
VHFSIGKGDGLRSPYIPQLSYDVDAGFVFGLVRAMRRISATFARTIIC